MTLPADPMLSIIVPTYSERENIGPLIRSVTRVLAGAKLDGEIVVVDDASPDGTAECVRELMTSYPVRVVVRENARGLSGAVLRGIDDAQGDVLAVMDADHSHPPEALTVMHTSIAGGNRLVVGSRHVAGGSIEGWPAHRRWISRGAAWLAAGLTPVRDPMSGYLMFRREILEGVELAPLGFKFGLELLVKARHHGAVAEVPIRFVDRRHGESKPLVCQQAIDQVCQ